MNGPSFNFASVRSEKARIAVKVSGLFIKILYFLSIVTLLFGITLLFMKLYYGWTFVGLAFVPAMIVEWYYLELSNLLPVKKSQSIELFLFCLFLCSFSF